MQTIRIFILNLDSSPKLGDILKLERLYLVDQSHASQNLPLLLSHWIFEVLTFTTQNTVEFHLLMLIQQMRSTFLDFSKPRYYPRGNECP